MAWLEPGLVYVICGAATAYLVRTIYRIFRPARADCSCDKCDGGG